VGKTCLEEIALTAATSGLAVLSGASHCLAAGFRAGVIPAGNIGTLDD
jgi:hypothetical protein